MAAWDAPTPITQEIKLKTGKRKMDKIINTGLLLVVVFVIVVAMIIGVHH